MAGSEVQRAHQPTSNTEGEDGWTTVRRKRRQKRRRQPEGQPVSSVDDGRRTAVSLSSQPEPAQAVVPGPTYRTDAPVSSGQTRTSPHLSRRQRRRRKRVMAQRERQQEDVTPSGQAREAQPGTDRASKDLGSAGATGQQLTQTPSGPRQDEGGRPQGSARTPGVSSAQHSTQKDQPPGQVPPDVRPAR